MKKKIKFDCEMHDNMGYRCYKVFTSEAELERHKIYHIRDYLIYDNYFYKNSTTNENHNRWIEWRENVEAFMLKHYPIKKLTQQITKENEEYEKEN